MLQIGQVDGNEFCFNSDALRLFPTYECSIHLTAISIRIKEGAVMTQGSELLMNRELYSSSSIIRSATYACSTREMLGCKDFVQDALYDQLVNVFDIENE